MDINLRLFLDIEDKLITLDGIFKKYIEIPNNLLYIRGARFPVTINEEYQLPTTTARYREFRECEMGPTRNRRLGETLSSVEFYPVHSVICIATILKKLYIADTQSKDLFITNPHIPMYSYSFISNKVLDEEIEDTVLSYVGNMITREDMSIIVKAAISIFNDMYKLIPDNLRNNEIYFNLDSEHFICEIGIDIRAFRYEEYHDHIEYNIKPQR